jgi:hypothetical protein
METCPPGPFHLVTCVNGYVRRREHEIPVGGYGYVDGRSARRMWVSKKGSNC